LTFNSCLSDELGKIGGNSVFLTQVGENGINSVFLNLFDF